VAGLETATSVADGEAVGQLGDLRRCVALLPWPVWLTVSAVAITLGPGRYWWNRRRLPRQRPSWPIPPPTHNCPLGARRSAPASGLAPARRTGHYERSRQQALRARFSCTKPARVVPFSVVTRGQPDAKPIPSPIAPTDFQASRSASRSSSP
jgi:hypothetical protein